MHPHGDKILLSEQEIKSRVAELGGMISEDYAGKDLLVIGILKGAIIFLSDLVRSITIPSYFDFIDVSSYGNSTTSSGEVRILKDVDQQIENRHVLIVEDIIDTGLTLDYLVRMLNSRGPASLKICTLLDKPSRRVTPVYVHYRGFSITNDFVVGYGLDFGERYRNLPYIMALSPKIYGGGS